MREAGWFFFETFMEEKKRKKKKRRAFKWQKVESNPADSSLGAKDY